MPAAPLPFLFEEKAFGSRPVVILDGGMGTTLQAPPFELGLDSALWSSELLTTEAGQQTLHSLHSLWVESGAEVLGCCSYQSSLPMFLNPSATSYSSADLEKAHATMVTALRVITSDSLPKPKRLERPVAALSLGPFGAQLQPGQEYAGLYPAPYGTKETPSTLGFPKLAAEAHPLQLEWIGETADKQEDNLAAWHLQRLEDFAKEPAFEKMGILAFETTPVLREALAIRRAMDMFELAREGEGMRPKAFYISFVFPLDAEGNPRFPDPDMEAGLTLEQQAERIVGATFGEKAGYLMPAAVGVNCTNPLELEKVVEALGKAFEKTVGEREERPWLVLYPDGGSVYDVVTRTWSNPTGMDEDRWATLNTQTVKNALSKTTSGGLPLFGGIIVGGCCKAGPGAIKALRAECEKEGLIKV